MNRKRVEIGRRPSQTAATADTRVRDRTSVDDAPQKRLTIDIPASLHARVKAGRASWHQHEKSCSRSAGQGISGLTNSPDLQRARSFLNSELRTHSDAHSGVPAHSCKECTLRTSLSEFFGIYLDLAVEDDVFPLDRADIPDEFRIEREVWCGGQPGDLPCLPIDHACQDERQASRSLRSRRAFVSRESRTSRPGP